jgi:hypothetical protein
MNKVMTVALMLSLMVLTATPGQAAGGKGTVRVSAMIPAKLSQKTLHQPTTLKVTSADVARGYLDIPAGTVLQVSTNDRDGYVLSFAFTEMMVNQAEVRINGRSVLVPADGGLVHLPFAGLAGQTIHITYRLFLAPGTTAGSYGWPVLVAAALL